MLSKNLNLNFNHLIFDECIKFSKQFNANIRIILIC